MRTKEAGMWTQPNWKALADEYAREHVSERNQICHFIGIPLILLALVKFTQWPAGHIFPWIALGLPVYFLWSARLGVAMTAIIVIMALIAYYFLNLWSALGVFIVGWIFQLVGHYVFEKNRPSLSHNLIHLFVGPAWIVQKLSKAAFGISLWS